MFALALMLSLSASPAPSRWLWVESMGGTHLCFFYVDRSAGPSCKGFAVSDPPTADELKQAIDRPNVTVRLPTGRGVSVEEVQALGLPPRPKWLDLFEPPGSPAPTPPSVEALGRLHAAAGGPQAWQLQNACGLGAGGYWMMRPGASLAVGSAAYQPGRAKLMGDGIAPTHFTLTSVAGGVELKVEPGASLTVNAQPAKSGQVLKADDRLQVAGSTLIVRAGGWRAQEVGTDPSCPGYAERLSIQDGCSMYGSSHFQLIGGASMEVGTDTPSRTGLPPGHGTSPVMRVTLKNVKGVVELTAHDSAHRPLVKGTPVTSAKLEIGDQFSIGDRVFAVSDAKSKSVVESPLPSCPEAVEKQRKKR